MKFNLRGLLQDEEFLLGAGLLSAGSQGQNVGQAVFPSLLQAAKVKKAFGDTAKSTKSVWSIKDGMNVLVSDQMIKADKDSGVNNYLPAKKTDKKRTISDEALKVYDKLQGLTGPAFDNAFEALPENEKNVYIKQIKGN